MRILHTSDWHVGRLWRGITRMDEMRRVLENLADYVKREKIDLILHSGDVFDTANPPGEAEQLVYDFFLEASAAGAKSVVVAGNHDDPARFDARARLTALADVTLVGKPRTAERGGVIDVIVRDERAVVAVLPFASPGIFVSALEFAGPESEAHTKYAAMFQKAVESLQGRFRADTVNLFVAHTHLQGAVFGNSERRVHVGEDWAATPQSLPHAAHYVALGHIHAPQQIPAPGIAMYAGSAMQLDFGELGQEKSFVVVEAVSGRPPKVERMPYEGATQLAEFRGRLEEIAANAESLATRGWLRVVVQIDSIDPEIARKVRDVLPNAVIVNVELPEAATPQDVRIATAIRPVDEYALYHAAAHRHEAKAAVLEGFERLYEQATRGDR